MVVLSLSLLLLLSTQPDSGTVYCSANWINGIPEIIQGRSGDVPEMPRVGDKSETKKRYPRDVSGV